MAKHNRCILSLDPSSTCTGWAVLATGEQYLASGRLLPKIVKIEPKGLAPYYRIDAMCLELRKLLEEYRPCEVVMEWTSGKRAGRLGQNVSHLAIYGVAVGAIWREAVNWTGYWTDRGIPCAVTSYLENDWTRGKPKDHRIQLARMMFTRDYDPSKDAGGDEADALMLNVHHQREERIRQCTRSTGA